MSEIKLNKVSRDYGLGIFGVRDISLAIKEGEFMVLLGPSGCGKSTTLRMIAGLEETTDGQISIAGRDVTRLPPRDRNVAVVFQSYALYPHMSVRENMRFGMKMRKTPRDEQDRRILQAADVLGLQPCLDRKPSALSGGQRQRVALGRAIVREPDVFLMDEPLSNLDAKLRGEMRQELVKLHRRVGKTTVFVTHDHVEAMTMGDRICIMRNGLIEQVGAPLEVYADPCNTFVAQFLAAPAMNLVPAVLRVDGERLHLGAGPIAGHLPERETRAYRATVGRALQFGLRAEDILTSPKPGCQAFAARLTALEALGPENLILVESEGHSLSARVDRHFLPQPGETITLYADLAHMHLFDAESGNVIVREP